MPNKLFNYCGSWLRRAVVCKSRLLPPQSLLMWTWRCRALGTSTFFTVSAAASRWSGWKLLHIITARCCHTAIVIIIFINANLWHHCKTTANYGRAPKWEWTGLHVMHGWYLWESITKWEWCHENGNSFGGIPYIFTSDYCYIWILLT